jgi:Tfp pilus assembly protein FimV
VVHVSTTAHVPPKLTGAPITPDRDDTAADDTDALTSPTDTPAMTTSDNPNRRIRLSFSTQNREWHESTPTV